MDLLLEGLRIRYRPALFAVGMIQTRNSLILRWDGGYANLRREGPYIKLDCSGPDGERHATYLTSDRTILENLRRIMDTLGIPQA